MSIEKLPNDLVYQLAKIQLQSIVQVCTVLTEGDTMKYMNYIITGAQALKRGFVAGEDNDAPKTA